MCSTATADWTDASKRHGLQSTDYQQWGNLISLIKCKKEFFLAAAVSELLYGCTTRTLTKPLEKKLDGNSARMLRTVLNKSWYQYYTKLQMYGHLPPISQTIQIRRTRHAGHFWRSKNEPISEVLRQVSIHRHQCRPNKNDLYSSGLCRHRMPSGWPSKSDERWREREREGGNSRESVLSTRLEVEISHLRLIQEIWNKDFGVKSEETINIQKTNGACSC